MAALPVAHGIERGQNPGGDLAGFFQYGAGEIAVEIVIARNPGAADPQHVMQHKLDIPDRGGIGGHGVSLP